MRCVLHPKLCIDIQNKTKFSLSAALSCIYFLKKYSLTILIWQDLVNILLQASAPSAALFLDSSLNFKVPALR